MRTLQTYDELFQKLTTIGIEKTLVKRLLPPYYKKSNEQSAILQTASFLADIFSLDLKSLLLVDRDAEFIIPQVKYKHRNVTNEKDLQPSTAVIIAIIKKIVYMLINKQNHMPADGIEIRNEILNDKPYVDFYSLIDYCWKIGIPVIFIESFPKTLKKMQGMSLYINERPVIVLTKHKGKSSWYNFTLAHELGHILKKHVNKAVEVIFDENISGLDLYNGTDKIEIEANHTAKEILTGNPLTAFRSSGNSPIKPDILADVARKLSKDYKIDPGFIILNYAWNMTTHNSNHYSIAETALGIIKDRDIDIDYLNKKLKDNINLENLPEESIEYIKKFISI